MDINCFVKVKDSLGHVNYIAQLSCVPSLINVVAKTFLMFGGAISLSLVIWGGVRLITSGGDAKQVQAARQIITTAILGLVVVLSSFALVYFVGDLTGTTTCITSPE